MVVTWPAELDYGANPDFGMEPHDGVTASVLLVDEFLWFDPLRRGPAVTYVDAGGRSTLRRDPDLPTA
ncbi:hypothetical protein [Ferrimicrobium sp.]|uniref:hypothetical protein n=1 Tax=Ferrimicrobium sp. TaxID=2926050 RepID=UPI00262B5173|nr:hypothetical protein [Ferrimicrobium sp.]